MSIINIKCEYLTNPLGIDILHPRIRWNLCDIKQQIEYEIAYSINGKSIISYHAYSSKMEHIFKDELGSRDFVKYRIRVKNENGEWSSFSEESYFSIGLLNKTDWRAKWIRGNYKVNKKNRYPVDTFFKEFDIRNLSKATLYISSLGLYEAFLNDSKVGKYVLTPGSTDYRIRVQYDTYDVTDLLKEGKNTIKILLSDGWYRGSIGAKGFTYVFGKNTKVIAQLECLDIENNLISICTDNSFLWSSDSQIRFADLKDGEIVDMNISSKPKTKAVEDRYYGEINSSNNVNVEETETFEPNQILETSLGNKTYCFLNNLAGYISFNCLANQGDEIHIKLAEIIDENNEATLKNVQCKRKNKLTPLQVYLAE